MPNVLRIPYANTFWMFCADFAGDGRAGGEERIVRWGSYRRR